MSSLHATLPGAAPAAMALAPTASAAPAPRRYLFGPWLDFFCLGGSSLLYIPLLWLRPAEDYRGTLAVMVLLLANAINHPHFAHSYQIFYRDFGRKVSGDGYGPDLRRRYILAGIVVPIAMAAFFAVCLLRQDARTLGYAANVMAFVVGWHYVKQGYGMLMVDAALKRLFFTAEDKKLLLANSYAVWVVSWLLINVAVAERTLWGIQSFALAVPMPVVVAAAAIAAATTLATLWRLARRWAAHGRRLPVNGVVAYGASLYAWLLLVRLDPLWFLVVPVLHSLQYLTVVWRFEANRQKGRPAPARIARRAPPCRPPRREPPGRDRPVRPRRVRARLHRLLGCAAAARRLHALRQGGVRQCALPVRLLDFHQRPPLLSGQRDVAPGEPRHQALPVRLREPKAARPHPFMRT